jgi:hypothetical protein
MLQYWHGIDLPPHMVLPKTFTQAVAKQAKPITGFGSSWGNDGNVRSVTFWFDGGSWIKTQCYQDRWPDAVYSVINVQSYPVETPAGLFEAVEAVSSFNDDRHVTFADNMVMSHHSDNVGAQYEVIGLQAGKQFNSEYLKKIAPFAKTIDLTTFDDRAFFFGGEAANPVRGAIMGMRAQVNTATPESSPEAPPEPPEPPSEAEGDQSQGWGGWGQE